MMEPKNRKKRRGEGRGEREWNGNIFHTLIGREREREEGLASSKAADFSLSDQKGGWKREAWKMLVSHLCLFSVRELLVVVAQRH